VPKQQALSQHSAPAGQQSGPQGDDPSGQTHSLPLNTFGGGQAAGFGVGAGRRAACASS
jgi:hypothetical protein